MIFPKCSKKGLVFGFLLHFPENRGAGVVRNIRFLKKDFLEEYSPMMGGGQGTS